MNKIKYFIAILSLLSLNSNAQTITDIDGNIYNTVTIGTQTWMQENLKTTRFNNGIKISTTSKPVFNDSTALYQWAYDDDTSNINKYGRLYTWLVATNKNNVCPVGWKVPDNADWDTLTNFLGGALIAGGKMKQVGTTHWQVSDTSVTNSSGFSALGGGFRGNPSGFRAMGETGVFWSSSDFGLGSFPRGFGYRVQSTNNELVQSIAVGQNGRPIRCIKNQISNSKNAHLQNDIQIFPNPAIHRLTISLGETRTCQCSIYDLLGNLFYEQKFVRKTNDIELDFLPTGIYIIKISTEKQRFTSKFIKQ